jgi:glycosyltransferase involved in cell wall biosynthesis
MHVLHVIPSLAEQSGGPAAAIVPMCRALQTHGIDPLIVTTNEGRQQADTGGLSERDGLSGRDGVAVRFFPVQLGASYKYSRPLAAWLEKNVKDFDLVHVHAVFNHASVAAARVCRKSGVPYVVRPLGTLDPWSMKQKPVRKHLFWFLFAKRLLTASAAVHYTAAAEKTATEEYFGLNHGRVVPLGVNLNGITHDDSVANHFPELAQQPYVLSLSRLHPKKNLDELIDAFKSLKDRRWRLVVAGDGPKDYLTFLKEKARGEERIVFAGWVEGKQKDALMRGASLFVLPSRHENFGLSVVEAMACGIPVLISPEVNLAREIESAEAGWVVSPRDLGNGLAAVIENEDERRSRGKGAYEFAKRFSWDKVATELADFYKEILERS